VIASAKIVIVAALEREVWPLVKDWPVSRRQQDLRWFKFFEKDGVALVCGGIGPEAARRAAEAAVSIYHPQLLISAGFAGALSPKLSIGQTFTPQHVVDAGDGSRIAAVFGHGVLVSSPDIADVEQKIRLGNAYGADAVDMEAAAVARCAAAHDIRFLACKVISDNNSTSLPPIARFVGSDGCFHAVSFVGFVLIRPWLWGQVLKLARDSSTAAARLCETLGDSGIRALGDVEVNPSVHADSEGVLR